MSSESMTSVALLKCKEHVEAERKDQCRFEHERTTERNLLRRRRRSRTRLTRDNLAFNLMKLFLTHSTSSIDARLHSVATITIFQFPEYNVAQTVLFLSLSFLRPSSSSSSSYSLLLYACKSLVLIKTACQPVRASLLSFILLFLSFS
jgi:hypothetical protein